VIKHKRIEISSPSVGIDEWEALREPFETGWLTQGPKVAAFEAAFAKRHGVRHAIATTSCTTGLHLTLTALGIGPGDEVIVPAFTWVASANAVIHCGATPVLVDIDRTSFNLDPDHITKRITPCTKAIMAVHLFGLCADIDKIRTAVPDSVRIIEDAACAAGAMYKGKWAGGLGDAAVFSFHPRKTITTGEGGMVTTNDNELAVRLVQMRNHGASISEEERHRGQKPFILPEFKRLGFNYRMTDLQGAIGLVQLSKLDVLVDERAKWSAYYRENLSSLQWLKLPEEPINGQHAWQAFVTYVDPETSPRPRNEIMGLLQQKGIATRPGTHAIHLLEYYRKRFDLKPDEFPHAYDCDRNTMTIPLHNRMALEDYTYIVDLLQKLR